MLPLLNRLVLPLWAICSFAACQWLPGHWLIALTPWLSGTALLLVGLTILLAIFPLYPHRHAYSTTFWAVALAAALTPLTALVFGAEVYAVLAKHHAREIAVLIWILCSLGLALTVIVSRLVIDISPTKARGING